MFICFFIFYVTIFPTIFLWCQLFICQAIYSQLQYSPNTSNAEMETLRKQISEYVTEINQLKTVVQKLSTENSELKSKYSGTAVANSTNINIYEEPL